MNSKQKICAIAAGVMAVSSVMPVLGADYSKELQEAYKWAYENGVTTMNTIDQANMYGNLTRIAMAKMLANYAINNLGKKPDTSIDCTFPDVTSAMDKAYDNGVTNACQLGIMGQGITNFDPNGTVTRAQFGTALSRLLWGDKNNASDEEQRAGVQYYKYHLNALNKSYNGTTIMKDISNPSQNEVRGYVMLMLQRSAGMVGKSTEECTATQQLLCLLEGNCTSACEEAMKDINKDEGKEDNKQDTVDENEVKSGKLTVGVEDYSSEVRSIPHEGMVIVNSINFKGSEEITLHSVTFETSNLTRNSDIKAIWFEKDGSRIGARATVDSEGVATVNFNGDGVTVKKSESYDLVMELAGNDAGAEISFKITDVDSSAVAGGVKISQANTTTMRTTSYTVASTKFEALKNNDGTTYKLGERDSYELGRFKVTNQADARDEKTLEVKTITLKNIGTADVDALSDIEILRDSKVVSSKATTDGKYITVTLNDEITAGKTATYTLQGKINAVNGTDDTEYYQFAVNKNTDIVVDEIKNGFRSTVTFEKDWDKNKDTLARFNVIGGKFTFKTTSNSSSVNAGEGYSDVLIAEGELIATVDAVIEEGSDTSLKITGEGFNALKNIKIEIGGKTYTANIQSWSEARTNGDITLKKGTQTVKVYANLRNNILSGENNKGKIIGYEKGDLTKENEYAFEKGYTIKINNITAGSFSSNQWEYSASSEQFKPQDQIAGTIAISNIKIIEATFGITKTSTTNDVRSVATAQNTNVADNIIFAWVLENTQEIDVNLNTLTISGVYESTSGFNDEKSYLDIELIVDEKTVDSKRFGKWDKNNNYKIEFNGLGINLTAGNSKKIELRATPVTQASDTWVVIDLWISAEGNDSNSNSVYAKPIYGTTYSITAKGSIVPSATSKVSSSVFEKSKSNNAIAQWNVVVKDEELSLKDLVLSGIFPSNKILNDFSVTVAPFGWTEKNIVAGSKIITWDSLKMENISNVQLSPNTYTFKAYASFGDVKTTTGFAISGVSLTLEWVGPVTWSETLELSHTIMQVVPTITKSSEKKGNLFTIVVHNNSQSESINVSWFVLKNGTVNKEGVGTGLGKVLIKNGNQVIWSGIVDASSWTIVITDKTTISAKGWYQELIIETEKAVTSDRTLKVSIEEMKFEVIDGWTWSINSSMDIVDWNSLKIG